MAQPIAGEGLRTIPPRENCGNVDAKQLTRGSRLLVPVAVDGALYSVGDGHFAQGDGECCITAIEMGATAVVRFKVHEQEAARRNIRWPRFAHPGYFAPPEWAAPRNFIATMGMPIRDDGANEGENLTLAARNALINMIELLQERGWTREQAYILCSVAVDLKGQQRGRPAQRDRLRLPARGHLSGVATPYLWSSPYWKDVRRS